MGGDVQLKQHVEDELKQKRTALRGPFRASHAGKVGRGGLLRSTTGHT